MNQPTPIASSSSLLHYFAQLRLHELMQKTQANPQHSLWHVMALGQQPLYPAMDYRQASTPDEMVAVLTDRMQQLHTHLFQDAALVPSAIAATPASSMTDAHPAFRQFAATLLQGGFWDATVTPETRRQLFLQAWPALEQSLQSLPEPALFPYGASLVLQIAMQDMLTEAGLSVDMRRVQDSDLRTLHLAESLAHAIDQATPAQQQALRSTPSLQRTLLQSVADKYLGGMWRHYCGVEEEGRLADKKDAREDVHYSNTDVAKAHRLRLGGYIDSSGRLQRKMASLHKKSLARMKEDDDDAPKSDLREQLTHEVPAAALAATLLNLELDTLPANAEELLRERLWQAYRLPHAWELANLDDDDIQRRKQTIWPYALTDSVPAHVAMRMLGEVNALEAQHEKQSNGVFVDEESLTQLMAQAFQSNQLGHAPSFALQQLSHRQFVWQPALTEELFFTPVFLPQTEEQLHAWQLPEDRRLSSRLLAWAQHSGQDALTLRDERLSPYLPAGLADDERQQLLDITTTLGASLLFLTTGDTVLQPDANGKTRQTYTLPEDTAAIVLADGGVIGMDVFFRCLYQEWARSGKPASIPLNQLRFQVSDGIRYDILDIHQGQTPDAKATPSSDGIPPLDVATDLLTGLPIGQAKNLATTLQSLMPVDAPILDIRDILREATEQEGATRLLLNALCGEPDLFEPLEEELEIDTETTCRRGLAKDSFRSNVDFLITTYAMSQPITAEGMERLEEMWENEQEYQELLAQSGQKFNSYTDYRTALSNPQHPLAQRVAQAEQDLSHYLLNHIPVTLASPAIATQLQARALATGQHTLETTIEKASQAAARLLPHIMEWLGDAIQGKQPSAHPLAVFTMGGGGSGKSKHEASYEQHPEQWMYFSRDADRMQFRHSYLAQNAAMHGGDWQDMVTTINAAHRMLADAFAVTPQKNTEGQTVPTGVNLHNDGSLAGGEWDKYWPKIAEAKADGYETAVLLSTIPTELAIPRVKKRQEKQGRPLSVEITKDMHANASLNTLKALSDMLNPRPAVLAQTGGKGMIDHFYLLDNSRGTDKHAIMAHTMEVTPQEYAQLVQQRELGKFGPMLDGFEKAMHTQRPAALKDNPYNNVRDTKGKKEKQRLEADMLYLGQAENGNIRILAIQDAAAFRAFISKGLEYEDALTQEQLTFASHLLHMGHNVESGNQMDRLGWNAPMHRPDLPAKVGDEALAHFAKTEAAQAIAQQPPVLPFKTVH